MSNRRLGLIVAAACALIAALVWIYWPERPQPSASAPPTHAQTTPAPATPLNPTPGATLPDATPPSKAEIDRAKEQKLLVPFLTPIAVFGRVVDESGNPLSGATVEIGINDRPFQTGSKYTETTNPDGRFSLTGVRGLAFSVKATKEGYYSYEASRAHRNVVTPSNQDAAQPTEDSPLVLTLRRQGATEPLKVVSSRQIDVPRNGQPITVDLTTGQVGRGNLQVESWVGDSNQRGYEWRYRLSVPGGGIVQRNDRFAFEAPENGYADSAEAGMAANAEKWSSRLDRDYFTKLPDGTFARFTVRFYPGKRNFIVVESYLNPKPGSRNLEYDASKQASAR